MSDQVERTREILRQRVTDAVECYASEQADIFYHSSQGVGEYTPRYSDAQCDFTAALDALIHYERVDAQAAMECYGCNSTEVCAASCRCVNSGGPTCKACSAKAEMEKVLEGEKA